jgi:hypothetical protein
MKPASFSGGIRAFAATLAVTAACLFCADIARAHITYGGRDFGVYSGTTNGSFTITNQTVTGNYGWADAADGILGDSHRGRAFRFHLNNATFVSLTVSANPFATTNSLGGFTPAYSIYAGLAAVAPFAPSQTELPPSADHDFCDASMAWRTWWVQQNLNPSATDPSPTDGSWNAVGDWMVGGDGDLVVGTNFSSLSLLAYKGSVVSYKSGGTVSGSFTLPAGDYTIFIGGNDIANKTAGTALSGFGISATLAVSPTPFLTVAPKVFLAWPSGITTNWVLQTAASPADTNWTTLPNRPVTVDGKPGVMLDMDANQQFFRFNYVP